MSFTNTLDLWYSIENYLKRAAVKKGEVDTFPFLSGNAVGDDKTYYVHAFKYYIPIHARQT